ncbi:hypothetical protein BDA96_03G217700 [Sorghum bicolor]|uniref:Uncharacterized protein n=1 Tax=Sorghum bicolor TaxID=4558 RepID=A0A921RE62_SORBI|nr:hypothetical protein BDA96_03G217700 [Sorghum bicolor]
MAGVFQRFVPQIKSPKVVVAIYLFLPFDFSSLMCAGWGVAAGGDLLHHGAVLGGRDAQDRAKKTRVCSTMTPKSGDNLHNLTVLTTEKFLLFDVVDPHLATSLDFFHGQLPYSHPIATLHG